MIKIKLIFVRHGKDDDRYRGGWSDLDLTPKGVEQSKQLAKHLKDYNHIYQITNIISSDLTRTLTTANIISSELELPIQKDARIREINNGDLAGMLNDIALKRYPDLFFKSLTIDEAYPNGESPIEFYERIKKWFFETCHKTKNNTLIVTHGGVINIIYHLTNDIEWNNKRSSFKSSNCSIHILNVDTMKFEIENKTDFLLI